MKTFKYANKEVLTFSESVLRGYYFDSTYFYTISDSPQRIRKWTFDQTPSLQWTVTYPDTGLKRLLRVGSYIYTILPVLAGPGIYIRKFADSDGSQSYSNRIFSYTPSTIISYTAFDTDGTNIWVLENAASSGSPTHGQLFKIDPSTGTIINTYDVDPTTGFVFNIYIKCLDNYVFITEGNSGTNSYNIRKFDGTTGTEIQSYPITYSNWAFGDIHIINDDYDMYFFNSSDSTNVGQFTIFNRNSQTITSYFDLYAEGEGSGIGAGQMPAGMQDYNCYIEPVSRSLYLPWEGGKLQRINLHATRSITIPPHAITPYTQIHAEETTEGVAIESMSLVAPVGSYIYFIGRGTVSCRTILGDEISITPTSSPQTTGALTLGAPAVDENDVQDFPFSAITGYQYTFTLDTSVISGSSWNFADWPDNEGFLSIVDEAEQEIAAAPKVSGYTVQTLTWMAPITKTYYLRVRNVRV